MVIDISFLRENVNVISSIFVNINIEIIRKSSQLLPDYGKICNFLDYFPETTSLSAQ